jgi:hypothetical protein
VHRVNRAVDPDSLAEAESKMLMATAVKKKANELGAKTRPWRCTLCHKDFETRWEAQRHAKACRQPSSSRVVIKKGDEARCDICKSTFDTSEEVRDHIFYRHSIAAILGTYRHHLEGMMRAQELRRLRKRLMKVILKGDFASFVEGMLEIISGESYNDLDKQFPVARLESRLLTAKRTALYGKKQELLLKLAEQEERDDIEELPHQGYFQLHEAEATLEWDLSFDIEQEALPDKIAAVLRITLEAKRLGLDHVPHFLCFTRSGMRVTLHLARKELTLREVIDNRSLMVSNGRMVIKGLMQALLQLQDNGILLRHISPDSITISCDYHSMFFNDLSDAYLADMKPWRARVEGMPYDAR